VDDVGQIAATADDFGDHSISLFMEDFLARILPSFPQKMRKRLVWWVAASLLLSPMLAQALVLISTLALG